MSSLRRGLIFILSAPSGTGKTTLADLMVKSDDALVRSMSVTTRPKREQEVDGRDYKFITEKEFAKLRDNNELLEHAQVFDKLYGTPKQFVEDILNTGKDVIFCIDWQGALQLKILKPRDTVLIFLLPPSIEELRSRLEIRGMDSAKSIKLRLSKAKLEIEKGQGYDYVIVNDNLAQTLEQLLGILNAERLKTKRQRKSLETLVHSLNKELE